MTRGGRGDGAGRVGLLGWYRPLGRVCVLWSKRSRVVRVGRRSRYVARSGVDATVPSPWVSSVAALPATPVDAAARVQPGTRECPATRGGPLGPARCRRIFSGALFC